MENTEKTSSDKYFIAALISLGAEVSKVDRTDPRHVSFTVKNQSAVIDIENQEIHPQLDFEQCERFWVNSSLVVNARKFMESLQRVNSLIYSK